MLMFLDGIEDPSSWSTLKALAATEFLGKVWVRYRLQQSMMNSNPAGANEEVNTRR